jgi:hypothetical protein
MVFVKMIRYFSENVIESMIIYRHQTQIPEMYVWV